MHTKMLGFMPKAQLEGKISAGHILIAEDEAREYKGETEETIQKTHNYATRVHTGQATMVGNDHPWCAAFVNWCLREAGVDTVVGTRRPQ